jgi:hypothetical protein
VLLPCTYQFTVPAQPAAVILVEVPLQIFNVFGVIEGATGFGFTDNIILATLLLQVPF